MSASVFLVIKSWWKWFNNRWLERWLAQSVLNYRGTFQFQFARMVTLSASPAPGTAWDIAQCAGASCCCRAQSKSLVDARQILLKLMFVWHCYSGTRSLAAFLCWLEGWSRSCRIAARTNPVTRSLLIMKTQTHIVPFLPPYLWWSRKSMLYTALIMWNLFTLI